LIPLNRIHKSWHRHFFFHNQNFLNSGITTHTNHQTTACSSGAGSEHFYQPLYVHLYPRKFACFHSFPAIDDEQLQFLIQCSRHEFECHLKQMAIFILAAACVALPKNIAVNIMKILKEEEKNIFLAIYSQPNREMMDPILAIKIFLQAKCNLRCFSIILLGFLAKKKQIRRCFYYLFPKELTRFFVCAIRQKNKPLAVYDKWFKLYLEHENPKSR